ncbi:MAG TPA: DUF4139 domain-containing protein [Candidatus Eisenbacteria bacterium]|nr:DUF4139 domain-containing protein [Candidatus Eisenbacteria bacterium]
MSPRRFVLVAGLLACPALCAAAGPAVTIYSRDLGFVRETRALEMGEVRDTVRVPEVGDRIDFTSVRLVPAGGARVTRLAYRYDAATGDGLIERARGYRVRVASRDNRTTEGTLVAADGAWLVVRADDGTVYTVARTSVDEVRLANPPKDMLLRPTIEAVVEGGRKGRLDAELSYLTGGLSWSAEHTLVRTSETSAVWSAAVTIENSTGREFRDATLKLVAGEPRRDMSMPPRPMMMMQSRDGVGAAENKADMSEQSFADYHLYTIDRPATLRDKESQNLTMLEPHTVKVAPRYLYRGGSNGVAVQLILQNTSAAGLGVPLAGGRVRIYEPDADQAVQFTGETRIAHTAEGEKVTLEVGTAFDLAVERREVSNKRITDREREMQVEIKLRNRKKSDVTIVVEEPVAADHDVLKSSHPATSKDANTLQFTLPIPAGKEVVLSYTVRVRY